MSETLSFFATLAIIAAIGLVMDLITLRKNKLKKLKEMKNISSDLQRFIKIFNVDKYKELPNKIEVRGIQDVEKGVSDAREIIEKNKLCLTVVNTAEMASYKAFEVIAR